MNKGESSLETLGRFPLLTAAGLARLRRLQEHPHAPRYNHQGVDRLSAAGLARVRAFEAALGSAVRGWRPGEPPAWLDDFVDFCFREVPAYRAYGPRPPRLEDIPTSEREELSRAPWEFVPDSAPLAGLTVFQTSGVTGHPLNILTHPETLAHYLPLLRAALARHGVALEDAGDEADDYTALAVVSDQATTYTYAATSSYLHGAGLIKLNLRATDWRDPDDRARFLDDCRPAVISGDPVALATLADLPLAWRPRALVSTSMALLPGLAARLRERFGCPVIDIYSMNETGPIAARGPVGDGWEVLSHRLYVEILDDDGAPCPPGTRGEVVVSGGFNPYLPLLRYRTGDQAVLDLSRPGQAVLRDLEGRSPVVFHAADGRRVNNIDVTAALKPLALAQFALHQAADGGLRLRVRGAVDEAALRTALAGVFGTDVTLITEPLDADDKVRQYSVEAADDV
ncbi:MAG: AMP-binding protein [Anaerolineales bacterium]|nr:AMP-binding protein [Anaerolineales bacterium]